MNDRVSEQDPTQSANAQTSPAEKEPPAGFRCVEISREPIELFKILKFEGMVASGGLAKVVVASGQVRVNGQVETQKRKKIISGDTIEFNDEKIWLKLASTISKNTQGAVEK